MSSVGGVQFNQPRNDFDEEQAYQRHLSYLRTQNKNSQGFQQSLRQIALGNEPTATAPKTAVEILGDEAEVNRRVQSIISSIFPDKNREVYNVASGETLEAFDKRARTTNWLMNVLPPNLKELLLTEEPNILAELKGKKLITPDTFVTFLQHYSRAFRESGGTSKYQTNERVISQMRALFATLPTNQVVNDLTRILIDEVRNAGVPRALQRDIDDVIAKLSLLERIIPSVEDFNAIKRAIERGNQDVLGATENFSRMQTGTIMERLELLLSQVSPSNAELQHELQVLQHLIDSSTSYKDAVGRNTIAEVAEIQKIVEQLQEDLGEVREDKLAEIMGLLASIKGDSSSSRAFTEALGADSIKELTKQFAKELRNEERIRSGNPSIPPKVAKEINRRAEEMAIEKVKESTRQPTIMESFGMSGDEVAKGDQLPAFSSSKSMGTTQPEKWIGKSGKDDDATENQMGGVGLSGFSRKRIDPRYARVVGRGLALTEEPKKFYEFGKYMLSMPHLQNNILKVKYLHNGGEVPSFKSTKISSEMTDFLEDLCENGKMNERQLNKLSSQEKRVFSKLINQSGLYGQLKVRLLKNPDEEKEEERFELIKGEFISGNDNPVIIKELKHLIIKFMTEGRIPKSQGNDLLFQLSI